MPKQCLIIILLLSGSTIFRFFSLVVHDPRLMPECCRSHAFLWSMHWIHGWLMLHRCQINTTLLFGFFWWKERSQLADKRMKFLWERKLQTTSLQGGRTGGIEAGKKVFNHPDLLQNHIYIYIYTHHAIFGRLVLERCLDRFLNDFWIDFGEVFGEVLERFWTAF